MTTEELLAFEYSKGYRTSKDQDLRYLTQIYDPEEEIVVFEEDLPNDTIDFAREEYKKILKDVRANNQYKNCMIRIAIVEMVPSKTYQNRLDFVTVRFLDQKII